MPGAGRWAGRVYSLTDLEIENDGCYECLLQTVNTCQQATIC